MTTDIVRTELGGYIDPGTIIVMSRYGPKEWGIKASSGYNGKYMNEFWVDEDGNVINLGKQRKGAKDTWKTAEEAQEAADRLFDILSGGSWDDH
jgi:hypothetical protein